MKIGICNDHAGVDYKNRLSEYLAAKGYEIVNFGTDTTASMDYPDVAHPLAEAVIADENGHTSRPGVFASGDAVNGARTVVEAVAHSKKVAEAMHAYIQGTLEKE